MTNSHRMCLNSDHKRYILKEFEELKDYGFKVKIKIKLLFRHCLQYFLEKSQDTYFYNHTFTYVCSLITVSLVTTADTLSKGPPLTGRLSRNTFFQNVEHLVLDA